MSRKSTWREISLAEARELNLPKNWIASLGAESSRGLTVAERLAHLHDWLVYPAIEIFVNDLKRSNPEEQARWEARHALGYYMAHCGSCKATRQEFADEPKSVLEDDVGIWVSAEERYEALNLESGASPTQLNDDRFVNFKIPWPISDENHPEVIANLRSAQQVAENLREQVLASYSPGRAAFPRGCNKPVATLAENLAAAAMKLNLSRLDSAEGRGDPSLERLVAIYNERAAAFADMWELVLREDWVTLRARYGNTRRDMGAGCLQALAVLTLTYIHRN